MQGLLLDLGVFSVCMKNTKKKNNYNWIGTNKWI